MLSDHACSGYLRVIQERVPRDEFEAFICDARPAIAALASLDAGIDALKSLRSGAGSRAVNFAQLVNEVDGDGNSLLHHSATETCQEKGMQTITWLLDNEASPALRNRA